MKKKLELQLEKTTLDKRENQIKNPEFTLQGFLVFLHSQKGTRTERELLLRDYYRICS